MISRILPGSFCPALRTCFATAVMMAAICCSPSRLNAQATQGTIVGNVSDPSGSVIPGASVILTNTQEGAVRTTKTNRSGDYQFLDLAWGASREDVQSKLKDRSFNRLERDEDGDEQYQGRVDGRDAAVYAMFAGDKLSKVMVLMLAPDDVGGDVYSKAQKSIAAA